MKIDVEQIIDGKVEKGKDVILNNEEKLKILEKDFGKALREKDKYIVTLGDKEIKLYIKQITYLGNPHPIFKKRIQISKNWNEKLKDENAYLIGLYKYKNTVIYALFDKTVYVQRNSNNSSAHISTFDLLNAEQNGLFQKKDIRGNLIYVVKREKIKSFMKLEIENKNKSNKEIELFEKFKNTLKIRYEGITCYKEMIKDNYRNKFQPEWSGFYIEFKFENFLNNNSDYKKICRFESNKKSGEIDLDLNFNNKYLGDLKVHSNNSPAIPGNDRDNIVKALTKYGKIWYVVFNHNTIKDLENKKYETTKFWNKAQGKIDLFSYKTRMKKEISFTDFKIIEINNYNKQYLKDFNQGKNSNGKERKVKIKINKRDINNFLIYYSEF